jgi:hypothetical protein
MPRLTPLTAWRPAPALVEGKNGFNCVSCGTHPRWTSLRPVIRQTEPRPRALGAGSREPRKPAILEESVGNHFHERMTVKALPGSALEVIKTKFFFQLLVSLLADPSRLDGGR